MAMDNFAVVKDGETTSIVPEAQFDENNQELVGTVQTQALTADDLPPTNNNNPE